MRHFVHLGTDQLAGLFERPPEEFGRDTPERLPVALGATLYIPGARPALLRDITTQAAAGTTSVVLCLEDSVPDELLPRAESNVVEVLQRLHDEPEQVVPLLFVRVRDVTQIKQLVVELGPALGVLTGLVLPKFTADDADDWFAALDEADRVAGTALYAMPVLESGAVLHAETRFGELTRLREILGRHRERILAIRLGATDLCALYGLRRSPELSIYEVKVVADLITDVVNLLGRADGTGFTLTGPVWEYFPGSGRLFMPQLRRSPFDEHDMTELRSRLVSRSMDGLIREIQLDKANGLIGKTTIHPTHVPLVNALHVVSSEEHRDAVDVLDGSQSGGVRVSMHGNKMNEVRPHAAWARATVRRAVVFGVAADGVTFVDLLSASLAS